MYRQPPRNPLARQTPVTPVRDMGYTLEHLETSPGARKLELQRRRYGHGDGGGSPLPYAELRAASAFSFLDGASQPEDLVARAAALDLPAVALIDRNGVYGAPRFYKAAREAGIKALVGVEVVLEETVACGGRQGTSSRGKNTEGSGAPWRGTGSGDQVRDVDSRGTTRFVGDRPPGSSELDSRETGGTSLCLPSSTGVSSAPESRLTLLVASRQGYRNLCRLLTAAARDRPKGEAAVDWSTLEEHAAGLHCLTGGAEGPVARALGRGGLDAAERTIGRLAGLFDGRLHVELQRHRGRDEEWRNQALAELGRRLRLPLVATNGVRYAKRRDKALYDVLSCIRLHTDLDAAGRRLDAHRERHLKSAREMAELFADLPQAVAASAALAERLDFTLADLGYRFPDYPLPPGETMSSYLREVTWNEARARFRPLTARAQAQIGKELDMIDKLDLAGYFLIVWDVIQFCKREQIMVQGRGSAANSAVCYALSITAVDPVKMELLFERFLSEERGEWPDVDLDLPSGDQREKVIQYVYGRYGPRGAAMTANVITYRDRSAAREVAKALGYSPAQVDRLAKQFGRWSYDKSRGDPKVLARELAAAGFDAADRRILLFATLWQRIQNLPRHLGQHSGGMIIAAGRLDEVVPLEPAAMENRIVVQWDKDDCADLGIIKIDLLGLGMLQALEEAIPLIRAHEGVDVDLAHLPVDDEKTYAMLRAADTVGVFQVESRAQMASLPRNAPTSFYDLVIQVAIIRPGPIVGGMVNPYFERRRGRQEVAYAHSCLEPILARTLGVVLFQEQILRIAMDAAGFTGGQAEELRRAMGFKRSAERMGELEENLRRGMAARGITGRAQEEIVRAITSFALYGFPESHAASFALIAYASAYLKAHHPTAFLIALLNAWPMGFYHPATLVKDAQRHGVEARPIDVNHSRWECSWDSDGAASGAARIGLRYARGLQREAARSIVEAREAGPFTSADDLARRAALSGEALANLADIGALASLGLSRRAAQWQVAAASRPTGPLLREAAAGGRGGPLPEMTPFEETLADYAGAGLTTGRHPVSYLRADLRRHRVLPAATLPRVAAGSRVRIAGSVIVRQRPGTAKGMLFVTLEDETGMAQAIVTPQQLQEHRTTLVGSAGLVVEGILERRDGSLSIKAEKFWPLVELTSAPSHDFR
ncbi:MAG: error-prone DNA polymerase [Acidobacteriota bacterium]|nr:error-prone DNA polymerase [Acidobacteriota bacterium]MDH3522144.1 error-prone DNA polymerase [Acidobacteriota bacterium]